MNELAPPGAGLPRIELAVARLLLGVARKRGNVEAFSAKFASELQVIRQLVRDVDPAAGERLVLIPRLRGMEDSSRHWSVWMTLEHLRIVNLAFAQIISALAQGIVPPGEARTADVKPRPGTTADVIAPFEDACVTYAAAVAEAERLLPGLKSTARFTHPWFGPLDAYGWHALAGHHMAIHRAQIERILAALS